MKPTPNKAFNAACAKYMGHTVHDELSHLDWVAINIANHKWKVVFDQYNPHDNMNQLLPVVDKIFVDKSMVQADYDHFIYSIYETSLKQALINFVSEALNIEATN